MWFLMMGNQSQLFTGLISTLQALPFLHHFIQEWWRKLLQSSAASTPLNALWGEDGCCLWGLCNEGWSRKILTFSSSQYDSHEGSEHCRTRLVHCQQVWNLLTACGCLYQTVGSIKKTCTSPTLFFTVLPNRCSVKLYISCCDKLLFFSWQDLQLSPLCSIRRKCIF